MLSGLQVPETQHFAWIEKKIDLVFSFQRLSRVWFNIQINSDKTKDKDRSVE